jgi:hypothetical protein
LTQGNAGADGALDRFGPAVVGGASAFVGNFVAGGDLHGALQAATPIRPPYLSAAPMSTPNRYADDINWIQRFLMTPVVPSDTVERTNALVRLHRAHLSFYVEQFRLLENKPVIAYDDGWMHVIANQPIKLDLIVADWPIHDFYSWHVAWGAYTTAVLRIFPWRAVELAQYHDYMAGWHKAAGVFKQPAWFPVWYNFDKACRAAYSHSNTFALSDVGAFAQLQRDFSHTTNGNPHPTPTPKSNPKPMEKTKPLAPARPRPVNGVCWAFNNFNGVKSCTAPLCQFAHVCLTCRGSHSEASCPSKDPRRRSPEYRAREYSPRRRSPERRRY